MRFENLKIPNRKGCLLHAQLVLPEHDHPSQFAIFAHSFSGSSSYNAVRYVSQALTNHGFGVLRFDFTGLGRSQGEFADSYFSANVDDIIQVHEFMTEKYEAPSLLVGHSLGGAAVITAANRIKEIEAVATIGAPADVAHVKHHFIDQVDVENLKEDEAISVNIGGRDFMIDKEFIEDFSKINLLDEVKKLHKPIIFFHSPYDKIVGIENAQKLYLGAYHPKSFVSLDGADHLLKSKQDSIYVGNMIGVWVNKYFPKPKEEKISAKGEQVVGYLDAKEDKFTTQMVTKKHHFLADEPLSVGGDDFGPSPYELLSSSLAACTAMTIRMYANRKKWEIENLKVYVTHSKIEDPNDAKKKIDLFEKKIEVDAATLNDEQIDRLVEIGAKCPVHKTLNTDNKLTTQRV